jgi:hypothetical protein
MSPRKLVTVGSVLLLTALAAGAAVVPAARIGSPRLDIERPDLRRGVIDVEVPVEPERVAMLGGSDPVAARHKGAEFLLTVQRPDGGWGAGNWGEADVQAPSDVATSAVVVLALLRDAAGTDRHHDAIQRGIRYVIGAIERGETGTAYVDTPRGTQPQRKLGEMVDTHMAAFVLAEAAPALDKDLARAADKALGLVVQKVQLAQKADGSFDGNGWAPILSTSIAATSLYRAMERGVEVDREVLAKSESYQANQAQAGEGSAGVELYGVAGALRTNDLAEKRDGGNTAAAATKAETARRVAADVDGRLMAGFGSVGGEEMMGYMLVSDTLAEAGGKPWNDWNGRIGAHLAGIQNADGSWVGHHCITSTTFTTAAAVLTLGSEDAAKARAARAKVVPAAG